MAMLQNFALQKEKMKAKYLKYYFSNALLVFARKNQQLLFFRNRSGLLHNC
jgi:hypothetical protein